MKTVFLRMLEEVYDKESVLLESIRKPEAARGRHRFEADPRSFSSVLGSPFAYWVSDRLRDLFKELEPFEAAGRVARRGVNTNDDQRFLRLAWECGGSDWVLHVKGGVWSPYYADPHMLLKWGRDGEELQAERVTSRVYKFAIIPSRDLYLRPGLAWPRRTKSELSLRVMSAGCVFGDKGPAAFVKNDDYDDLLSLLAIGNSKVFRSLVEFQLAAADARPGGAAHSYEVGVLQRTPIPWLRGTSRSALAQLAHSAWSLKRSLDTRTDTSHAFTLPALLQVIGTDLAARVIASTERLRSVEAELADIQADIDARCFDQYGLDQTDRRIITEGFGRGADAQSDEAEPDTDNDAGVDDEGDAEYGTDTTSLVAETVSWAVGVAFGRFDVRLATGARPLPAEPDPFEPLPVCSPAMLTGDDGFPLTSAPAGYPLAFPESGILVDDSGHPHDLIATLRAVFHEVFGKTADARWEEASALLDPGDHNLRVWLASSFFEHHLKRYSKSRRKAPIFWQLSTSSGRYSVWLYAHGLTRDSFFQIQNDVVGPKLAHEERQLTSLMQAAAGSPSAKERKEIAAQETFVEELRIMLEEVKRVTPLWIPTLDDGIVLTMAPFWRLMPQHKPWQKELKSKWDELAAGKYDWAHIAMHLWPERVVPKCATDRSLAIAHGLEGVFWVENPTGKWTQRPTPAKSVEELVRERTSPAVKAALQSLLDTSQAPDGQKAGRQRASFRTRRT